MIFPSSSDVKLLHLAAILIYPDRRLTAISIIDATGLQHLFINVAVVLMVYLRCFCGWCHIFCFCERFLLYVELCMHVCHFFFRFSRWLL